MLNQARVPGLNQLVLLTIIGLFLSHALAFFLHEYCHSFTAWFLGFKAHPLNITYGSFNLSNVLLQQEIDENVDYGPILASGHGGAVAAIALAGVLGNALLYLVCALSLYLPAKVNPARHPVWLLGVFLLALMSAGNLWAYAPVRTLTTHGDMANAAHGLGITTLRFFPFVVIPSVLIGLHFFAVVLPLVLERLADEEILQSAFLIALACLMYFGFFGSPAIGGNYGNASAVFSIMSIFVLQPLILMMLFKRDL